MKIDVITLFPKLVSALKHYGVVGRALQAHKAHLNVINLRDHTPRADHRVDDRPYGGGPGMVLQYQPLARALQHLKSRLKDAPHVVYLSPQGQPLHQAAIRKMAHCRRLVLVCGRYEGIDERFIDAHVDAQWSLGDYVISGGELAAMVVIDAVVRTLPGVLGDDQSAHQDSFETGLLDYPHFTRPASVDGLTVPKELLGGDHQTIARWRLKQALGRTYLKRPDLIEKHGLNDQERLLLNEYLAEIEA